MAAGQGLQLPQQQRAAAIQAAMAEHPRQAHHLQLAIGQRQAVALGQGVQVGLGRRLFDTHLPELAMPRAIQFAGLAVGGQLLARALDPAALFADQEEFAAGQAGGQAGQQVVGQFAGLGQEQNGRSPGAGRRARVETATVGEAGVQLRLLAGVPAPALGLR